MKQLILGTAGHIDHGKTTLVKALTGTDTDRLKEEKARGITIELGFAALDLPSGQRLGIVDVPGHEKFVKNMVAGAAGIDLVALVIAADEGVMPQTREHLDICRLLEVKKGLIVLTKVDMVDEEWLELVTEDVEEYVEGSFLEGAPVVPVSGVTGRGIDELKKVLDGIAADLEESPASGPFRLPVDRVFSMRGFGTVVTGTAVSGRIEEGQEVTIYPSRKEARVRGLQVHGQETKEARRGQRTAINLQGLDKDEVERGQVVASKGSLVPSLWLDLDLTALPDMQRPIKHRAPIRFHTGTVEAMGRVLLLDRDILEPGQNALCQVRLDGPVAVMAGDRFVMRSYSPVATIAGGVILHPYSRRHKRNRPDIQEDLATLKTGSPAERVAVHARLSGASGITVDDLVRLVDLSPKELNSLVGDMLSKQELVRFDKDAGRMAQARVLEELSREAVELVGGFHQANPLKPGMPKEELKQRLGGKGREVPARLFTYILGKLTMVGGLAAEKEMVRLPTHKVRLAGEEEALQKKILAAYREGGAAPPNYKDVIAGADKSLAKEVTGVLMNRGDLVRIRDDLFYHAPALEKIKDELVAFLKANERIGASQFKEMTGLSRKYVIPLLEYFDAKQVTMRVGDERLLRGA